MPNLDWIAKVVGKFAFLNLKNNKIQVAKLQKNTARIWWNTSLAEVIGDQYLRVCFSSMIGLTDFYRLKVFWALV